jgi:hypothetical protein
MKLLIAAALLTVSVGLPDRLLSQPAPTPEAGTWRMTLTDRWTNKTGDDWVSLQLQLGRYHNIGTSIRASELEGAGIRGQSFSAANVRFALVRSASRRRPRSSPRCSHPAVRSPWTMR